MTDQDVVKLQMYLGSLRQLLMFDFRASPPAISEAVFIYLMVYLNDILRLVQREHRVSFNEDVRVPDKPQADVTDLVSKVRNACCHIGSPAHIFNDIVHSRFCMVVGKGSLFNINGQTIGGDYEDDIAFIFGPLKIYYRRHIIRAFNEAALLVCRQRPPA
jgi:hypothetical protein